VQVYLRDLGARRFVAVLNRRAQASAGRTAGSPHALVTDPFLVTEAHPQRKRRRAAGRALRRFWVRGLKLDSQTEAVALAELSDAPLVILAAVLPICLMPLLLMPGLVFLGIGGATPFFLWMLVAFLISAATAAFVPRSVLRQISRRPLTLAEADVLYETATVRRDRLERAYLGLVRDVLACETVPAGAAQDNLRDALRSLGDTISRLPASARDTRPHQDAAALGREAFDLKSRAATETDPLVAASLLRRAGALNQRANLRTPEQEAAARRARALRQELESHVETLRDGLLTFEAGKMDASALKHLAQAVQHVSSDAQAVQEARAELDDEALAAVLSANMAPVATQQPTAPKVQQVGNGTGSGPWWRNSA